MLFSAFIDPELAFQDRIPLDVCERKVAQVPFALDPMDMYCPELVLGKYRARPTRTWPKRPLFSGE